MKKFKFFTFVVVILFFSYLTLDFLISLVLYNNAKNQEDKFYLKNYPVVMRSLFTSKTLVTDKLDPGQADYLKSFALLGYFKPEFISIIKNGKKVVDITNIAKFKDIIINHKKNGGKILIALGGSTTAISQISNWPTPIEKLLKDQNFIVINAGHNAYTSYQENILLFKILFPILNPILPDIVISLTGVNDISRSFSSILNTKKFNLKNIYKDTIIHGEFLVKDIIQKNESSISKILKRKIAYSKIVKNIMPSASQLMVSSFNSRTSPETLYKSFGSINKYNILRYCNIFLKAHSKVPDFFPHRLPEITQRNIDGVHIFKNFDDAILNKEKLNFEKANNLVNQCANKRDKIFSKKKKYKHSNEEEILIVNEILQNHYRTKKTLESFGVQYFAFLQPVSYKKLSLVKDIPSINYILIHWYMQNQLRGHDIRVSFDKIYRVINTKLKSEPFKKFFFPINNIFHILKDDPYTADNIHYKPVSSKLIAVEIYKKSFANPFIEKPLQNPFYFKE